MIAQRIHSILKLLIAKERSYQRLAASFCIGVYIAFSPFIGLHTVMVCIFSWLFRLNIAVTFAGALLVNNPWTMIPVYTTGYFFGDWLIRHVLGFDLLGLNPWWMSFINESLFEYTGISTVSLWSFLVGGNLLGIVISVMLYPVMKRLFAQLVTETHDLISEK